MAIADFSNILNIFRGDSAQSADPDALFKEVLLMTLARATSSDANIDPCEVATVQRILKEYTGESFAEADIRIASRPTLFEEAPFEKYLSSIRKKLESGQRAEIIAALAKVIKSDTNIREMETDFFNKVATALRATPAEIIGLAAD